MTKMTDSNKKLRNVIAMTIAIFFVACLLFLWIREQNNVYDSMNHDRMQWFVLNINAT